MTNERSMTDLSGLQMPTMSLQGIEQPAYAIKREIARGANGVVFECTNLLLARREALKVWNQFRENDNRDKIRQGLLEAQAAANAAGDAVVKIFAAGTLPNGMFFCTMEFVQGQTLKQFLAEGRSRSERIALAQRYLRALQISEEAGVVHGDAHFKNVMLQEKPSGWELHFWISARLSSVKQEILCGVITRLLNRRCIIYLKSSGVSSAYRDR